METVITKATVKQSLSDILVDLSWAKIAQKYFGKSPSWLYHKLDGIDGNGNQIDFTLEEKIQLKEALCDFAKRITVAANKLA